MFCKGGVVMVYEVVAQLEVFDFVLQRFKKKTSIKLLLCICLLTHMRFLKW